MMYTDIDLYSKSHHKENIYQWGGTMYAKSEKYIVAKCGTDSLTITCHDLALIAWGIYVNDPVFYHKFGIKSTYIKDLNGGGKQYIRINGDSPFDQSHRILHATFSHPYDESPIYEADLLMDGRRDYHPVRNLGVRKFGADSAELFLMSTEEILPWINKFYTPWTEQLRRISKPHSTLLEWVNSGLDMLIVCTEFTCDNRKIIPNVDLREYMCSDNTLEALCEKFTCSSCRHKIPAIYPI